MTRKPMQTERKFMAAFMAATLCVLALTQPLLARTPPQSLDAESIAAQVRELQAKRSKIQVKLADGTELRGRIVRVEADSFTIRQEKTDQEVALRYAQVTEVTKGGLSLGAKVAVIAAIVGGGALLVFCIAPFPIGFLCREDPS